MADVADQEPETHCPACGYTPEDCATHLDHYLCSRYPFFPNEIARESSSDTGATK